MARKPPAWQYVGQTTFDTKGAAEKFAVSQREKKKQMGYNTRYEIDMDMEGKFRVREFIYMTDAKGKLV